MYCTLIFPLTLLTIYNAQGLVLAIGVYILVKFKFCAQLMHQICVIKHCILKLMDEKDRVISITRMAFHNDRFQTKDKTLSSLSNFT